MMRRFLSWLMVMTLLVSWGIIGDFTTIAQATADGLIPIAEADEEDFLIEDGVLSGYNGCDAVIVIPDNVTEIGYSAFSDNENITTVDISAGVKTIGEYAFQGCSSLETVMLPDGLESIGSYAFDSCSALEEITLPDAVSVSSEAFSNSPTRLFAALGSQTAKDLGRNGCYFHIAGNSDLRLRYQCDYVYDDETGQTIDTIYTLYAGAYNTDISVANIPSGVQFIEDYGFENCASLTEITIPETVESIGSYAFYNATSLESVDIPLSVKSIGSYAFEGCSLLSTVTLHEGLEEIGSDAFTSCPALLSLTIPSSVNSFGSHYDTSIHLFATVDTDSARAVSQSGLYFYVAGNTDVKLKYLYEEVIVGQEYNEEYDYYEDIYETRETLVACANRRNITSATIPDGVQAIEGNGFEGCEGLTTVTLPDSLVTIRSSAFNGCNALPAVAFNEGLKRIENDAFNGCSALNGVTLPTTLEYIGSSAFYENTSLEAITVPATVKTIDSSAFAGCESLVTVTLNEGLETIGSDAFSACTAMEDLTIPSTVTYFGSYYDNPARLYAAIGSAAAKSISRNGQYFHDNGNANISLRYEYVDQYDEESGEYTDTLWTLVACADNRDIASATIPDGVQAIEGNGFEGCEGLTTVTLPDSLEDIRSGAFINCVSLDGVSIPANVSAIGESAFMYCEALTDIEIPAAVETLGSSAFRECDALAEVTFNEGLKRIESDAFYQCSALNGVTLPTTLEYIGSCAFYENASLEAITVPVAVKTIDSSAFSGCVSLVTVTLNEGLEVIGSDAFSACQAMGDLTIPSTVTDFGYCYDNPARLYTAIGSAAAKSISRNGQYFHNNGNANVSLRYTYEDVYVGREYDPDSDGYVDKYDSVETLLARKDNDDISTAVVPEGVQEIEESGFENCAALTTVTLPDSLETIRYNAFYGCVSLDGVSIPANVSDIGESAFMSCEALTAIEIPAAVETLRNSTFRECDALAEVTFNEGLKRIESDAFCQCPALNGVTLPTTLEYIGSEAFCENTSLEAITVPAAVKTIDSSAFRGCDSLVTVTLNEGLETIGYDAFSACQAMGDLTIPSTVTDFGSCYDNPARLYTAIGSAAAKCISRNGQYFHDNGNPNVSLRYQFEDVYTGRVYDRETNQYVDQYETRETLTARAHDQEITSAVVPESVQVIEYGGFENCEDLTTIQLPETLDTLGDSAFCNCRSLTGIVIPNTVKAIPDNAFYGCESLSTVTLPAELQRIGSTAFSQCSVMQDITLPETVTEVGYSAFQENPARVYCSLDGVAAEAMSENGNYFNISGYPDVSMQYRYEEIYDKNWNVIDTVRKLYARAANDDVTAAVIPDGVQIIESYGFNGCSSLNALSLPESLERIEYAAFEECYALDDFTIPSGVKTVEYNSFPEEARLFCDPYSSAAHAISYSSRSFCMADNPDFELRYDSYSDNELLSLVNYRGDSAVVDVPFNVEYISYNAFSSLPIKQVNIPESVTGISDSAFYGCDALSIVYLPYTVDEIGDWAFDYCDDNLTFFVYAETYAEEWVQAHGYNCAYRGSSLKVDVVNPAAGLQVRVSGGGLPVQLRDAESGTALFAAMAEDDTYNITLVNAYGDVLDRKSVYIQTGNNELTLTNSAQLTDVHAVVRDANTRANLTKQMNIIWLNAEGDTYAEGADLIAVPVGTVLKCQVRMPETLMVKYAEIADQDYTANADNTYLSLPLTVHATKTLSGNVVEPKNARITVTYLSAVTQTPYTFNVDTDDQGAYSLTVPALAGEITLSAGGYSPKTLSVAADQTTVEDVTLEAMQGVRVNVNARISRARLDGGNVVTEAFELEGNGTVEVYNNTTGQEITNISIGGNTIVMPEGVSARDSLSITLKGSTFAEQSFSVNINARLVANVNLTLTEKGTALISGNQEQKGDVTLFLYDNSSQLAYTATGPEAYFMTPNLDSGWYEVYVMEASTFLDAPDSRWDLPDVAYAYESFYIEDGLITEVYVGDVPELDDSAFYATDPDRTVFRLSRSTASLGKNYSLTATAAIRDDVSASDFKWIFEIPDGSAYVPNTLSVNGQTTADAVIEGNTVSLAVADPSQTVRLLMTPIKSGNQVVKGYLRYIQNGNERIQSLGEQEISVEALTLNAQKEVYEPKVYVYGVGVASSAVKVYDGNVLMAEAETDAKGKWGIWVDLNEPGTFSRHKLIATFTNGNGYVFSSQPIFVTYRFMDDPVTLSQVKMYTAAHDDEDVDFGSSHCVIFDFEDPMNTTRAYDFNPSLPGCAFLAVFKGNTDRVSNVRIYVTCTDGSVRNLLADYSETYGGWYAFDSFAGDCMPTGVTVQYFNGVEMVLDKANEDAFLNMDALDEYDGLQEYDLSTAGDITEEQASAIDRYNDAVVRLKEITNRYQSELLSNNDLLNVMTGGTVFSESNELPNSNELEEDFTEAHMDTGELVYYRLVDENIDIVIPDQNVRYTVRNLNAIGLDQDWLDETIDWMDDCINESQDAYEEFVAALSALTDEVESETGVSAQSLGNSNFLLSSKQGSSIKFWAFIGKDIAGLFGKDFTTFIPFFNCIQDLIDLEDYFKQIRETEEQIERYPNCQALQNKLSSLNAGLALKAMQTGIHLMQGIGQCAALCSGQVEFYLMLSKCPAFAAVDLALDLSQGMVGYYGDKGMGGIANSNCPPPPNDPPYPGTTPQLDPSGFIYEAVYSNRVEGATVVARHEVTWRDDYDIEHTDYEDWDATESNQINPQISDAEGNYGWMVPDGKWKVVATKKGYQIAETGPIEVPPEAENVFIGLVSTEAPRVLGVKTTAEGYRVVFSKYMPVDNVQNGVTLTENGEYVPVSVNAINGEDDPDGVYMATEVLITPEASINPMGEITLTFSGNIENYAGLMLGEDVTYQLGEKLTGIEAPTNVTLDLGVAQKVTVKVTPAADAVGRVVTAEVSGKGLKADTNAVVNSKGEVTLNLNGMVPGDYTLNLAVSNSTLTRTINVSCQVPMGESVLKLPAALRQIETEAFSGIMASVVEVPATCEYIAANAFTDCPKLKYVIVSDDANVFIDAHAFGENVIIVYQ